MELSLQTSNFILCPSKPSKWHRVIYGREHTPTGMATSGWTMRRILATAGSPCTRSPALLAQQQLSVDGHPLPQGRVLVLGGDQVYPSKGDYRIKLQEPFRSANRCEPGNGG